MKAICLLLLPFVLPMIPTDAIPKGESCECAVFKNLRGGMPIMSRSPGFVLPCDEQGRATCKAMCIALAQAAQNAAPVMLCEILQNIISGLKPALFFKMCSTSEWEYTGLSSQEPLCCKNGKPSICQ